MTEPEERSPVVTPAEASGAALLAALVLFAFAVGGFVIVNQYWGAIRTVMPAPAADLGGHEPSE